MTPITLDEDDAAIVFHADGTTALLLPKANDDDEMPLHVALAGAIAARIMTDSKFVDEMLAWVDNEVTSQ